MFSSPPGAHTSPLGQPSSTSHASPAFSGFGPHTLVPKSSMPARARVTQGRKVVLFMIPPCASERSRRIRRTRLMQGWRAGRARLAGCALDFSVKSATGLGVFDERGRGIEALAEAVAVVAHALEDARRAERVDPAE